jgi:glutathione S-transferase
MPDVAAEGHGFGRLRRPRATRTTAPGMASNRVVELLPDPGPVGVRCAGRTDGRTMKVSGGRGMDYRLTALATIAMVVTYLWAGIRVAGARRRHGVKAPATTGPDEFNRVFRAQQNTLEQMAAMLPALWVFAYAVGDRWAALVALVWIVGRIVYVSGYAAAADKRGTGFMISFAALAVACVGAAATILMSFAR